MTSVFLIERKKINLSCLLLSVSYAKCFGIFPYPIDLTFCGTLTSQCNLVSVSLFYYNLGSDDIQYLCKQIQLLAGVCHETHCMCLQVCTYTYILAQQQMISSAPHINVLLILAVGLTSDKEFSLTILLRSGVFVLWAFVLFITHFKFHPMYMTLPYIF